MVDVHAVDVKSPAAPVWLSGIEQRPYRLVVGHAVDPVHIGTRDAVELPRSVRPLVIAIDAAILGITPLEDQADRTRKRMTMRIGIAVGQQDLMQKH